MLKAMSLFLLTALIGSINPIYAFTNEPGGIGELSGLSDMAAILTKELDKGNTVNLAFSVSVFVDGRIGDSAQQTVNNIKAQAEIGLAKDFREKFRGYKNFSIVDKSSLDAGNDTTHILTQVVSYGYNGEWYGVLIDMKTQKTVGEYYCDYLPDTDKYAKCK